MLYKYSIMLFALFILLTSCRSESIEQDGSINQPDLEPNSSIVTLIGQIVLNDGSVDNVIDKSNCFTIIFPYTLIVNGVALTIESVDDYSEVEDVLDESEEEGEIIISFPITILNANYTTQGVGSQTAFDALVNNCDTQTEDDDDIECLDFKYPIAISIFNTASENFNTIIINGDSEMFSFIEDFDENDIADIQFPLEIKLSDGTTTMVENIDALETLIETTKDDCDEDDDDDYNDDDCSEGCELQEIEMVLMGCQDWLIEDFKFDGDHTDDFKDDYFFNFLSNDILTVKDDDDNVFNGNWYVTVEGDITKIQFNIPAFPRLNMTWDLDDLDQGSSKTKIKLEIDKENHLKFENEECGEDDDN